jgi:hypothetical protein
MLSEWRREIGIKVIDGGMFANLQALERWQ